jgi:hypothetical protein
MSAHSPLPEEELTKPVSKLKNTRKTRSERKGIWINIDQQKLERPQKK